MRGTSLSIFAAIRVGGDNTFPLQTVEVMPESAIGEVEKSVRDAVARLHSRMESRPELLPVRKIARVLHKARGRRLWERLQNREHGKESQEQR